MNDWLNFLVFVEKKLKSGNCSIYIGRLLLEQQRWAEAARALHNGIEKGSLDDSNEALALLTECQMLMGDGDCKISVANAVN